MKKCGGSLSQYIGGTVMMFLLCVPLLALFLYLLLFDRNAGGQERLLYVGGLALFGGLLAFFLYRLFIAGIPYIEYDQQRVVFHFSRKLQWVFAWDALPEALVEIIPVLQGEWLVLRYRDRERKIAMYHGHKGYRELRQYMEQRGIFEAVRRRQQKA